MNTERPQTVTTQEPDLSRLDVPVAEYVPKHERQQFRLTSLGVTVDKYGRAHDAQTGRFMKMGQLSEANVRTLDLWQDYIAENAPAPVMAERTETVEPVRLSTLTEPVVVPGQAVEPLTLWERAKRKGKSLAGKGIAKLAELSGSTPRRRLIALRALAGFAIVSTTMKIYAGSRYGYAGSFEQQGGMFDLAAAHLGSTAAHHTAVAELTTTNTSSRAEVLQEFQPSYDSAGKQEFLSGFNPRVNTPAKLDVLAGFHPHVTAQEKQQLLNQLHPGVQHHHAHNGPNTNQSGFVDGFPTHVFVEHGHGVTQEFQDLVNAHGFNLTPDQYHAAYDYVELIVGGKFYLDNPMYPLGNGDLGISRSGESVWNPEALRAYHHWLEINGFLSE